jgi:hypothetical protein
MRAPVRLVIALLAVGLGGCGTGEPERAALFEESCRVAHARGLDALHRPPTHQGPVIEVGPLRKTELASAVAEILVQTGPLEIGPSGRPYGGMYAWPSDCTAIVWQDGTRAAPADLEVGMPVSLWVVSVRESDPAQADIVALRIELPPPPRRD